MGLTPTPSPEQIQAAMPAMREWWYCTYHPCPAVASAVGDREIERRVRDHYPGGVAQFIADQEERRG